MIIVIHPGSANLRIGVHEKINPVSIPHALAIKRRNKDAHVHRDGFLPATEKKVHPEVIKDLEESRLRMSHLLQSSLQSNGNRRYATAPKQLAAYNRRSKPEQIGKSLCEDWLHDSNIVVGEEIFRVNPAADYNIHYPIKRGHLNLHDGVGGSLFNSVDTMQTIWEYAIREKLGIPLKELSNYRAVLVIPDIFNRTHVKEMTNLILTRLGFDSCFLVQDHVAAMFGSGLGYGCVVDIGAEKMSVSCVEDGISQANTRVLVPFGSNDITQLFYWLLEKSSFPYHECNLEDPLDFLLISELKEKCHLNLDVCGAQESSFLVKRPNLPALEYTIQFGDELLIAPLALFHTELLVLTGPSQMSKTQSKYLIDAEDCFDEAYLRETCTRRAKEQMDNANDDEDMMDNLENDRDMDPKDKEIPVTGSQIMGLDQAILQSIEQLYTDENRKKMLSAIVLVGGGVKLAGIDDWLLKQLTREMPGQYINILAGTKEIDPAMTAWKGAAIMSNLESSCELWISRSDWERQGVKILRERAPFSW